MEEYTLLVLRKIIIDAAILVLMLCVNVVLCNTEPYQRGFFCGDETLLYPYRSNTVSSDTLHVVGLLLPAFAIVVCETATLLRRREEPRRVLGVALPAWLRGCYAVLVALGMGVLCCEVATNISKVTIGRLRPCFMDVCRPSVNCSLAEYQGRYITAEEFVCTNTQYSSHSLRDIRVSFMSGHSSWAAFTMVFLALYLQRRVTWSVSRLPRLLLQFSAAMLALFTALSRVSDNKHHWSDVLVGLFTGTLFAIITVTWFVDWVEKIEKHEHKQLPQHEAAPSVIAGANSA